MNNHSSLTATLAVGLILSAGVPCLSAQFAGATAYIPQTDTAPTVDGNIDAVWYDGYSFPIAVTQYGVVESTTDNSAYWRALYTEDRFYFLVDISDDYLTSTDGDAEWAQDRIEVFFNMDNVKPGGGNGRTGDNFQFGFNWNMPDQQFGAGAAVWTDVEWAQVDTDTGWRVEVSIPWDNLGIDSPLAGHSFGFDIAVNDNDGGALYDSVLYWRNSAGALFGNIDGAGTVTIGEPARATLPKIATVPTIDAAMDEIWNASGPIPLKVVQYGRVDDRDDLSATWYGAYDDTNLYFLVDINDAYLTSTDGDAEWAQDRIEVFFNMDNVKPAGGNGRTGDNFQYGFNWNMPDQQFGAGAANWTGVEWAQVDTDTGWRVEVLIPWTSLGIDPPSAGDSFGFDIAVNDNDGGALYDSVNYWHNAAGALFGNIDGAGTVVMGDTFDGNYPPSISTPVVHTAVAGTASSMMVEASDANSGDTLVISAQDLPAFASLTDNGDGTASIEVDAVDTDAGIHQFPVSVSDGAHTDTVWATLLVQVAAGAQAPVIREIQDVSISAGSSSRINVFVTDTDSAHVAISASDLPTGATFIDYGDKTARIMVGTSVAAGTYDVTVMAEDESGASDSITMSLQVYEEWRGLPMSADFMVDTGAPFGTVFVQYDPWIYVYGLSQWVYISADPSADFDRGWFWFSNRAN
jgi:hypothetical protein